MTSFDGLQFDVLNPIHGEISPQEIPEDLGLAINPMIFPANWTSQVVVKTRWQTDVSRALAGPPEGVALASRPVRSVSASFAGPAHKAAYSLLQSLQQHAFVEAPVPIYCDATPVTEEAYDGVSLLTVSAEFGYRRFFVGARVAIFSSVHRDDRNTQRTMFGIVQVLNSSSAVIELESAYRAVTGYDLIAPCIDCEVSEGSKATALTDGVVTAEITWNEIEGGSTLPPLWPSYDYDDQQIVSPLASIASFDSGTIPMFPGDIDWTDGIDIDLENPQDTSSSGRSRVLERTSPPLHTFTANLTCTSRQEAWSILRFFDSVQGRRNAFAFLHPIGAFTVVGTGTNYVEISIVGDPQAAKKQLRFIAVTDNTGAVHIRRVVLINDLTTKFRVTWDIANPVSNIVAAAHAFICTFGEDYVEESWITSGVTQMSFVVAELPYTGPVTVDDEAFNYETLIEDPLRSVSDCSLLFKAGVECYDADGFLCSVWPGIHHRVHSIRDISVPSRVSEGYVNRHTAINTSAFSNSAVVRLFDDVGFGTQPILMQAPMRLSMSGVQNPYDSMWGPPGTGWTMFFVVSPRQVTSAYQILWNLQAAGQSLTIYLDTPLSAPFATSNGGITLNTGSGTQSFSATSTISHTGQTRIVAFRMNFATNNLQSWIDGQPMTASATYSGTFSSSPDVTDLYWLASSDGNSPKSASTLRTLMASRMLGAAAVSYRRALTQDEMRSVYEALADIYFAPTDHKIVVL